MTSKPSCKSFLRFCKPLKPQMPTPRWGHMSWLDQNQFFLYVAGGYNDAEGYLSDLWAYDIRLKTWELLERDEIWNRCHAVTLQIPFGNEVVIFGGNPPSMDCQKFLSFLKVTPQKITNMSDQPIPSRRCHAGCIFQYKYLIYHGGLIEDEKTLTSSFEIFEYLKKRPAQLKYKNTSLIDQLHKTSRQFHSIVATNTKLYIIGGCDNEDSSRTAFSICVIEVNESLEVQEVQEYEPQVLVPRWGHGAVYILELNTILLFGGFSIYLDDSLIIQVILDEKRERIYGSLDVGRQGSHVYKNGVLFSFGGYKDNQFSNKLVIKPLTTYEKYTQEDIKLQTQFKIVKERQHSPRFIAQFYAIELLPLEERTVSLVFAHNERSEEDALYLLHNFEYFESILGFRSRNNKGLFDDIDLNNIECEIFSKLKMICSDDFNVDSMVDDYMSIPSLVETAEFLCGPVDLMERLYNVMLYMVATRGSEEVLRVFLDFTKYNGVVHMQMMRVSCLNTKLKDEEWIALGKRLGMEKKFSTISDQLMLYKYLK